MAKIKDLTGKQFGKLTALYPLKERKDNRIVWRCRCECNNVVDVKGIYLTTKQTRSCGCLKADMDNINLREAYDNKRVDGVAKQLFKGKEPRKDSTIGYRGVSEYRTRVSKELRYRAWIQVKGERYYKSGFLTPEEAYYKGRLMLEEKHLPRKDD